MRMYCPDGKPPSANIPLESEVALLDIGPSVVTTTPASGRPLAASTTRPAIAPLPSTEAACAVTQVATTQAMHTAKRLQPRFIRMLILPSKKTSGAIVREGA